MRLRGNTAQHNTTQLVLVSESTSIRNGDDHRLSPKPIMEEEQNGSTSREEQEEALVALIEHRTREVNNLRHRLSYYQSQVSHPLLTLPLLLIYLFFITLPKSISWFHYYCYFSHKVCGNIIVA